MNNSASKLYWLKAPTQASPYIYTVATAHGPRSIFFNYSDVPWGLGEPQWAVVGSINRSNNMFVIMRWTVLTYPAHQVLSPSAINPCERRYNWDNLQQVGSLVAWLRAFCLATVAYFKTLLILWNIGIEPMYFIVVPSDRQI